MESQWGGCAGSVWSLIVELVPQRELPEVSQVLGESLVDMYTEVHCEVRRSTCFSKRFIINDPPITLRAYVIRVHLVQFVSHSQSSRPARRVHFEQLFSNAFNSWFPRSFL